MNQAKKQILLKILDQEIKKAKAVAQKRRATAKVYARASRSQQGDRRYFENIADLTESDLEELLTFKKELAVASEKSATSVKPVCFVTLEYQDGTTNQFYFVPLSVRLPGLQLITPPSPLGQAIKAKKAGETFSYQIQRENKTLAFSGKVVKIE